MIDFATEVLSPGARYDGQMCLVQSALYWAQWSMWREATQARFVPRFAMILRSTQPTDNKRKGLTRR